MVLKANFTVLSIYNIQKNRKQYNSALYVQ